MSNLYISYVSRDKEFVHALTEAFTEKGIDIIDGKLGLGDSLSNSIRQGLQQSSHVLLILSKSFFNKSWPRFEFEEVDKLDRDFEGPPKLLPVWHDIDQQSVAYFAPEFAQRMGVPSEAGIDEIVFQVAEVIQEPEFEDPLSILEESGQPISKAQQMFQQQKSVPLTTSSNIMQTLRDNMNAYFNMSEIHSLCFDLGIEFEELSGDTRSDKVKALISFMQRHGRLDELIKLVQQQRPHASW